MDWRVSVCWGKRLVFALAGLAAAVLQAECQSVLPCGHEISRRAVTVEDGIRMKRLADRDCSLLGDSNSCIAQFSPDGNRFVIMTKEGNVERNTNEYSLWLYQAGNVRNSPKPNLLLRMSSSSNREAIRKIHWLEDNQTILFLGENPGETAEIYALDIKSKQLRRITDHLTSITNYDVAKDGREILFLADTPAKRINDAEGTRQNGMVIANEALSDLIVGNCASTIYCAEQQLFLQRGQEPPRHISVKGLLWSRNPVSVSADGKYGVVGANLIAEDLPRDWTEYSFPENAYMHQFFVHTRGATPFAQYWVVDLEKGTTELLWDAPMIQFPPVTWAPDSRSLFLKSYLPTDGTGSQEKSSRLENPIAAEVRLGNREIRKTSEEDFPKEITNSALPALTVDENLNDPPKVYMADATTPQKSLLIDLNPQFDELCFGKVETLEWKAANGIDVVGGLYLPPDYTPGKRYALVIQTHGFDASRFSMDGLNEWGSGYAARFLAAQGMVVLQAYRLKDEKDQETIDNDKKLGAVAQQAEKRFAVTAYEGAIDVLDKRGVIDRDRVGIQGFSRTVCFVGYALTHSKYRFAAAILVDGIDCGYFGYTAYGGHPDEDDLNGGGGPFGQNLNVWFREAPGFNLDKVRTPMRLEAHGASSGVLELWEWFSGLSRRAKPVEYVYLPDAKHMLVKPWERRASQQGALDWFRFWLNGEEDPASTKQEQYRRWRELRKEYRAAATP